MTLSAKQDRRHVYREEQEAAEPQPAEAGHMDPVHVEARWEVGHNLPKSPGSKGFGILSSDFQSSSNEEGIFFYK